MTLIAVVLATLAACGGSAAEGRSIGSSHRPEPEVERPVIAPEPVAETPPVAEPEPVAETPPARTGPPRLAASAHPPAEQRWRPAASRGTTCRILPWDDPEQRAEPDAISAVLITYTFRNGRIARISSENDAAAHAWSETRRLMPNGRTAGALVHISESASGPSKVRSRFTYRVDGRVIEETATTPRGPETTRVTYGDDGRPVAIDRPSTEADGRDQIACEYEGERLARIVRTGASPMTTWFEADEAGNVIAMHIERGTALTSFVIVRESATDVVTTEIREDGSRGAVTEYEGTCDDVILDPCSRIFVPPPP